MSGRGLLLVDDQPMASRAFARSVRLDFDVVICGSVEAARRAIRDAPEAPECAVLDLVLRDGTARDVVIPLRERFGDIPISIFTNRKLDDDSERIRELGVHVVARQHRPQLDRFLQGAPLARLRNVRPLSLAVEELAVSCGLRPREVRILTFLATGSTRTSLARDLGVKEDTLKSQLACLFERTGAASANDLLARLLRAAASGSVLSPSAGEPARPANAQVLAAAVDSKRDSKQIACVASVDN